MFKELLALICVSLFVPVFLEGNWIIKASSLETLKSKNESDLVSAIPINHSANNQSITYINLTNNLARKQNYNISIFENEIPYDPPILTINAGDIVTWKNYDIDTHTVTYGIVNTKGVGKYFNSGFIEHGETFKHKFDTSGEFPYFCSLHTSMIGKVIVK